jgi:hypothetical protein
MNPRTAKKWRVLSLVLKVIGVVGCVVTFGFLMVLISYYSAKRPHAPQPERGWTVGLTWTHPPSYGTVQEENRLFWLHWWFVPSFGLIALGEAIKIYKLDHYSGVAAFKKPPFFKRH